MTDRRRRASSSLIEQIIADGRARIGRNDRILLNQLLNAYDFSRTRLVAEIGMMEAQIMEALERRAPSPITDAWIRRQSWYRTLEASVARESEYLRSGVRSLIDATHVSSAREATTTARMIAVAGEIRVANVPALERWIASVQPGSPLAAVLDRYGADTSRTMRTAITDGIIRGRNNRAITTEIMSSVTQNITPYEATRIVRTETMRTYRGVNAEHFDVFPDDVIIGYRRIAGLDERTCSICVALHNHISPTPHNDFHVMCRCDDVPVFSEDYVEAPEGGYKTGEQWLAEQPIETQRRVLGKERFEAWQEGTSMIDMVEFVPNETWGGSSRMIPLNRLKRGRSAGGSSTPSQIKTAPPREPARAAMPRNGFSDTASARDWYKSNNISLSVPDNADMRVVNQVSKTLDAEIAAGRHVPPNIVYSTNNRGNAIANATFTSEPSMRRITFNMPKMTPDSIQRASQIAEYNASLGRAVWTYGNGSVESTVYHELGHIRHFRNFARTEQVHGKGWVLITKEGNEVRWSSWAGYNKRADKIARAKVSRYGQTEPMEFVAEVHAGTRLGIKFDDDVIDLYYRLGGPEL